MVIPSDSESQRNPHNLPLPQNVSAVYRQLANAYQVMLGETEGVAIEHPTAPGGHNSELLGGLIEMLMRNAEDPPREVHGMPEEFFVELDRVPKQQLKPEDACPICSNPFLEDKYPLVVRLPCHRDHIFDLECIKPWLKVNTTCPLDRKDLEKKKPPPPVKAPVKDDEEDPEWDDMYA